MKRSAEEFIYKTLSPFFACLEHEVFLIGTKIPIPKFSVEVLTDLVLKATTILQQQGPIIDISPPIRILGDIHGNLHDLFRIINPVVENPEIKLLFLGDYVDRGSYSLEVIIVLFCLLVRFPNRVFLIRGNHEFRGVCNPSGLMTDLKHLYDSSDLYDIFQEAFDWIPLAAQIGADYLCLHGGLSPLLNSIDDIRAIPYPIRNYEEKLVSDILWSDPCKSILGFLDSTRGCGVLFGMNVINKFLSANKLKKLIRAHQCVSFGVEFFNESVITVFSSSFYRDDENRAGYLVIGEDMEIQEFSLSPFLALKRTSASFTDAPMRLMMKPVPGMLAARVPSPLHSAGRLSIGVGSNQNRSRSRRSSSTATLAMLPIKNPKIEVPQPALDV